MNLVLDSHTFVWWFTDSPRLRRAAREAIENPDNLVYASAAVAWELATKVRLGKWSEAKMVSETFDAAVAREGFVSLAVSTRHAHVAGSWPVRHGDPFDRMLAAQAQIEGAPLVTADPVFKEFGIRTIW